MAISSASAPPTAQSEQPNRRLILLEDGGKLVVFGNQTCTWNTIAVKACSDLFEPNGLFVTTSLLPYEPVRGIDLWLESGIVRSLTLVGTPGQQLLRRKYQEDGTDVVIGTREFVASHFSRGQLILRRALNDLVSQYADLRPEPGDSLQALLANGQRSATFHEILWTADIGDLNHDGDFRLEVEKFV